MDCPHGFEAHVGWSSRCKNCFRSRSDHSAAALNPRKIHSTTASRTYDVSSSHVSYYNRGVPKTSHATTTSSAGVQDYAVLYGSYKKSASRTTSLTSLETSSHRPWQRLTSADDVASSKGISRPSHSGRYSYQEDNSKLLLEPSALKQSRESIQSASITTSYAPPEISNNYSAQNRSANVYSSNYRSDQKLRTSSAATTYLHDSYQQSITSYSSLPRNKTTRSDSTSSMRLSTPLSHYPTTGLQPSRRKWSSYSTPVTPLRSPATTPRKLSPIRTFSPLCTRRLSTTGQTYSIVSSNRSSRNNSIMASPAFSRSSSRRSSIGNAEDHINSRFINRDPFKDATTMLEVPTSSATTVSSRKYTNTVKYSSTNSLPRNFSVKQDPLVSTNAEENLAVLEERVPNTSTPYSTNTFPRRYRRSHRMGLPDLCETGDSREGISSGSCSEKHDCEHSKSFNLKLSSLVQCWKCQKSPPTSSTLGDDVEDNIRHKKKSKTPPSRKRSPSVIVELETSAVPLENLKAEKYPPIIKKLEEKNGNISAAIAESESSTLEDDPQTYAYKKTLEALRKRTTMMENSDELNQNFNKHGGSITKALDSKPVKSPKPKLTPKKPDRSKRKKGMQEAPTKAKYLNSKPEVSADEESMKTCTLSDSPGNDFEMECHLNLEAMTTDTTLSEKSIIEKFTIRDDEDHKSDMILQETGNLFQKMEGHSIPASQLVKDKTIMMANSISENVENDQENPRTDIATESLIQIDEDVDEEVSLSSGSETSIKTTMHFTYKNLDDARRDDVIDSEKLTRIPEDFMPKKDQENSIEKKMDSIDHDDKKCEMVNELLLCRKKENSKMDTSSSHVEKITFLTKEFKENDFETDSISKGFPQTEKEAESEKTENFPELTFSQDEVLEKNRYLESIFENFQQEQPLMLPPEFTFMENSDFVVYDDSIEKPVENKIDKISTSLKKKEIDSSKLTNCWLPDVEITKVKMSDNKNEPSDSPIFHTYINQKSGHLDENAVRKYTNEIMEEYKTEFEPPSTSTSYFSTYDDKVVDLHSVLIKEDISLEIPIHDYHSNACLDSEINLNYDKEKRDDNQNKFEDTEEDSESPIELDDCRLQSIFISQLNSTYQYDGDKIQDEHTFPIIDNQSSCETSNDGNVIEIPTPLFNELENKDLDFATENDDDLHLASLPQQDLSKVVGEKINEQDDQLNKTESEKGTSLLELTDIVFSNSFPGDGRNSVNPTTQKNETNVTPSSTGKDVPAAASERMEKLVSCCEGNIDLLCERTATAETNIKNEAMSEILQDVQMSIMNTERDTAHYFNNSDKKFSSNDHPCKKETKMENVIVTKNECQGFSQSESIEDKINQNSQLLQTKVIEGPLLSQGGTNHEIQEEKLDCEEKSHILATEVDNSNITDTVSHILLQKEFEKCNQNYQLQAKDFEKSKVLELTVADYQMQEENLDFKEKSHTVETDVENFDRIEKEHNKNDKIYQLQAIDIENGKEPKVTNQKMQEENSDSDKSNVLQNDELHMKSIENKSIAQEVINHQMQEEKLEPKELKTPALDEDTISEENENNFDRTDDDDRLNRQTECEINKVLQNTEQLQNAYEQSQQDNNTLESRLHTSKLEEIGILSVNHQIYDSKIEEEHCTIENKKEEYNLMNLPCEETKVDILEISEHGQTNPATGKQSRNEKTENFLDIDLINDQDDVKDISISKVQAAPFENSTTIKHDNCKVLKNEGFEETKTENAHQFNAENDPAIILEKVIGSKKYQSPCHATDREIEKKSIIEDYEQEDIKKDVDDIANFQVLQKVDSQKEIEKMDTHVEFFHETSQPYQANSHSYLGGDALPQTEKILNKSEPVSIVAQLNETAHCVDKFDNPVKNYNHIEQDQIMVSTLNELVFEHSDHLHDLEDSDRGNNTITISTVEETTNQFIDNFKDIEGVKDCKSNKATELLSEETKENFEKYKQDGASTSNVVDDFFEDIESLSTIDISNKAWTNDCQETVEESKQDHTIIIPTDKVVEMVEKLAGLPNESILENKQAICFEESKQDDETITASTIFNDAETCSNENIFVATESKGAISLADDNPARNVVSITPQNEYVVEDQTTTIKPRDDTNVFIVEEMANITSENNFDSIESNRDISSVNENEFCLFIEDSENVEKINQSKQLTQTIDDEESHSNEAISKDVHDFVINETHENEFIVELLTQNITDVDGVEKIAGNSRNDETDPCEFIGVVNSENIEDTTTATASNNITGVFKNVETTASTNTTDVLEDVQILPNEHIVELHAHCVIVNSNSSQTEIIEENPHYDSIDKVDGSQNKTNVNIASEVDISQINLESKFVENFENLSVENQTLYFDKHSKPSRDELSFQDNAREASKYGGNDFASLEGANMDINQEDRRSPSSVKDRPISLPIDKINDGILEDFEKLALDNIIEDNFKTIEEPVPLRSEQISTIPKSPHVVEIISHDFEESVQSPGVLASEISDGASTVVPHVANNQLQEERWDYTPSVDGQERSEVKTLVSPGDTFEATGGISDMMDIVGKKFLLTENVPGAKKSDDDNFEYLEANVEISENNSPGKETIGQFEKQAIEHITEQDSKTAIEPEPDIAHWNEKIIKGSALAIGAMAASAVVIPALGASAVIATGGSVASAAAIAVGGSAASGTAGAMAAGAAGAAASVIGAGASTAAATASVGAVAASGISMSGVVAAGAASAVASMASAAAFMSSKDQDEKFVESNNDENAGQQNKSESIIAEQPIEVIAANANVLELNRKSKIENANVHNAAQDEEKIVESNDDENAGQQNKSKSIILAEQRIEAIAADADVLDLYQKSKIEKTNVHIANQDEKKNAESNNDENAGQQNKCESTIAEQPIEVIAENADGLELNRKSKIENANAHIVAQDDEKFVVSNNDENAGQQNKCESIIAEQPIEVIAADANVLKLNRKSKIEKANAHIVAEDEKKIVESNDDENAGQQNERESIIAEQPNEVIAENANVLELNCISKNENANVHFIAQDDEKFIESNNDDNASQQNKSESIISEQPIEVIAAEADVLKLNRKSKIEDANAQDDVPSLSQTVITIGENISIKSTLENNETNECSSMLASEKENEYEIPCERLANDNKKSSPYQTLKNILENDAQGLELATSSSEVLMDNTKNQDKKPENEELLPLIASKLSETQSSISATGGGNNQISSETKNDDNKNPNLLAINEFQTVIKPSENVIIEEVVEDEIMAKPANQFNIDNETFVNDQSVEAIDIESITMTPPLTINEFQTLEKEIIDELVEYEKSAQQFDIDDKSLVNDQYAKKIDVENSTPTEFETVKKLSEKEIIISQVVENEVTVEENEKAVQQLYLEDEKFLTDKFAKEMGNDIENTSAVCCIEEKSNFFVNENQENSIFRTDLMNELMEQTIDVAQEIEQRNKTKYLNISECFDEKSNTDAHSNNDVEGNKYKVKEFKLVSNVSSAMEDAQKLPNQLVVGQNVLKKNASMNNVINNDNVNISSTSSTLDSYKAKSLSANSSRRNSNETTTSFNKLLQERRKKLVSYQPEDNQETSSEAIPEWMKTRASIFKKNVDAFEDPIKETRKETSEISICVQNDEDILPLESSWSHQTREMDRSENSSEGLPSLTQEWPEHLASKVTDSEFQITDSDLPLGEGCSVVCKPLPSAPSLDTISSLELDSLESSPLFEPEKVRPIFHKLRKKEKSLREKARTLETKLETAETHCYALVEENCELKTEIEVLEDEISEVQDRFRNEDMVEWRRLKTEVRTMAKACRTFQLKLKKSEIKSSKLRAENAKLAQAISKDLRKRHVSPQPLTNHSQNELWKSAAIWGAVLVAGYQLLKSKM